jgi:ABC-type molybdate transport system substrate-binding protein
LCGNRIVALIGPTVDANAPLLDLLLSERTRLATSTPAADPSGDYAYRLFKKADELQPGVAKTLSCKARHLAGNPSAPRAPAGQHHYAWVVGEGMTDIFLTYASNAVQAVRRRPELRIVEPPPELSVEAEFYGVRMDRVRSVGESVWQYVFGDRFSGHLKAAGFASAPGTSGPGPR